MLFLIWTYELKPYFTSMLTKLFILLNQLPPGTQNPDDNFPVDFKDPFEVLIFVILPLVIVVGYIFWKPKRNNPKD